MCLLFDRQTDPYYPFEQAVDVWARTFAALGINYKVSSSSCAQLSSVPSWQGLSTTTNRDASRLLTPDNRLLPAEIQNSDVQGSMMRLDLCDREGERSRWHYCCGLDCRTAHDFFGHLAALI